jgi:hypothetical protein
MTSNSTLFSLPNSSPSVELPHCSNFEHSSAVVIEPLEEGQDLSPQNKVSKEPATPKNRGKGKAKGKASLSEVDVRRSLRLKKIHKGFKSSSCKDKNCLGCLAQPPTMSPKVIRNLGASFCGINPEDLSPTKLNAKSVNKRKNTVSKKQTGSTSDANPAASTSDKNSSSKVDDAETGQSSKKGAAHPRS